MRDALVRARDNMRCTKMPSVARRTDSRIVDDVDARREPRSSPDQRFICYEIAGRVDKVQFSSALSRFSPRSPSSYFGSGMDFEGELDAVAARTPSRGPASQHQAHRFSRLRRVMTELDVRGAPKDLGVVSRGPADRRRGRAATPFRPTARFDQEPANEFFNSPSGRVHEGRVRPRGGGGRRSRPWGPPDFTLRVDGEEA